MKLEEQKRSNAQQWLEDVRKDMPEKEVKLLEQTVKGFMDAEFTYAEVHRFLYDLDMIVNFDMDEFAFHSTVQFGRIRKTPAT